MANNLQDSLSIMFNKQYEATSLLRNPYVNDKQYKSIQIKRQF